jgi:hypothetical protein
MLVKPQRPHVDRRRRERRARDAEVAESMLILFLLRRQDARAQHRHYEQLLQQKQQQLNLPDVIATGPTVWKRTSDHVHHTHIVYQDAQAPERLLHVVPDDNSDSHCQSEALPQESSLTTNSQQYDMTKVLRCPTPLGYVGMPLPVAPSLPSHQAQKKPQYLVRPRFPMVV